MQRARRRGLLCSLQLGLRVQMKGMFQSSLLIDELSAAGFSINNTIVQLYEKSTAVNVGADIPINNSTRGDLSIQYMADNFDHNVATLDGRNTMHGMGMMLTVTPFIKHKTIIPRVKVSKSEIENAGRITISEFFLVDHHSYVKHFMDLQVLDADRCQINLLWKASLGFQNPRPAWFGTMQLVYRGSHPGRSSYMCLPLIDMDPTNIYCMYSTLKFISTHASKYDVIPVVTFDQPQYWKAEGVQQHSDLSPMVIRLGGFHKFSFVGSIGSTMDGSGLQQIIETIYALIQFCIMAGKAIARDLRAHFIVSAALYYILMCSTYGLSSVQAGKVELEINFLECCEPEEDVDFKTATELLEMQFGTSEEIDIDMNNISEEIDIDMNNISEEIDIDMNNISEEIDIDMNNISEEIDIDMSNISEEIDIDMSNISEEINIDMNNISEEIDIDMSNISEEDSSHNSNNLAADLIFGATKTQISEHPELEHLTELFEEYISGTLKSYDILEEKSNDCLLQLKNGLDSNIRNLHPSGTSKLWLPYLDMTELIMDFIRAERTGNWLLHLKCLEKMLPFFAATGHNNYTKSTYLYMQKMKCLEYDFPEVYQQFINGKHCIWRSDRFWAGIFSDQIIEQCLMKNAKCRGGGRGVGEFQRVIWLLSVPVRAEINKTIQRLTGTSYETSEQHKEIFSSRMKRDNDDTMKIASILLYHNVFSPPNSLRNIITGVTANKDVNADEADEVGREIINDMIGK